MVHSACKLILSVDYPVEGRKTESAFIAQGCLHMNWMSMTCQFCGYKSDAPSHSFITWNSKLVDAVYLSDDSAVKLQVAFSVFLLCVVVVVRHG